METAENLVLQWKIIAICSLFLCVLLMLLLAIVYHLRYGAGRVSGAKDFYLHLTNGAREYHQKLGIFFRYEKFMEKEVMDEDYRNHVLKVSEKLSLN